MSDEESDAFAEMTPEEREVIQKQIKNEAQNQVQLEYYFNLAKAQGKMRDFYRIDDKLGEGAFGEVRRCVYKEHMNDKRSSIKDYRAVKIQSKAYMEEKELLSFKNEVACMNQINHPSIMKLHHFYEDPKRYLLITELCRGGDLYEYVHKKGKLDEKEASICIKQILSAINYMHS